MGARGPAPKPKNLRILEGNPGRLSTNDAEPAPERGAKCPTWLSREARKHWRHIASTLENCGLLTHADETCLAAYCDALARYISVTKQIDQVVIDDRHGKRINPLVTAQKNYAELMLKFGGRLGLSPSDRVGLAVKSKQSRGRWTNKIK